MTDWDLALNFKQHLEEQIGHRHGQIESWTITDYKVAWARDYDSCSCRSESLALLVEYEVTFKRGKVRKGSVTLNSSDLFDMLEGTIRKLKNA